MHRCRGDCMSFDEKTVADLDRYIAANLKQRDREILA
jgi:hypothetical protein